ncbi:MAG: hypothetical protein Ct9H300mP1_20510 [Planctomycetaceae bacterium]|nr:MAG: hypothetical protein Ct9H300mP1_20510 [Planctomycetaceae bacterium]
MAARSDRYATIRTVTHPQNDHKRHHFIQTGHTIPPANRGAANVAATNVDLGPHLARSSPTSTTRRLRPGPKSIFPPTSTFPNDSGPYAGYDINGQYAGWLGKAYDPMATAIPKQHFPGQPVFFPDCTDKELDFRLTGLDPLPGITLDRLNTRQPTAPPSSNHVAANPDSSPATRTYTAQQQQALGLIHSRASPGPLTSGRNPTNSGTPTAQTPSASPW